MRKCLESTQPWAQLPRQMPNLAPFTFQGLPRVAGAGRGGQGRGDLTAWAKGCALRWGKDSVLSRESLIFRGDPWLSL